MKIKLFFLMLLLPVGSLLAQTTYTTTIDNVTYQMKAGYSSCSVIGGSVTGDLVIPATVEYEGNTWQVGSIEANAFEDHQKITSVSIPDRVTYIGKRAFYQCYNLQSVTVTNNEGWGYIEVGEEAFALCTKLTTIGFAYKLQGIGKSAFKSCKFSTLTLPKVTYIRDYAFASCTSLTNLYIPAPSMPTTSGTAFQSCNLSSATLQVPSSCYATYCSTAPWSSFGTKVEVNTLTYMLNGEVYKTCPVRADATITAEAAPAVPEGYTFSGWEGLTATMPHADLTVTGTFVPKNYYVYYLLDGEFWQMQTVACGAWINPPTPPEKEGFVFAGWTGIPDNQKMPAANLTITGTYQPQCAAPIITYNAGEGTFQITCATEGATFTTSVQCWDIQPYASTSNEIHLNHSYTMYVTASKEGLADNQTYISLTWPDEGVTSTGDITVGASASEVKAAAPLLVQMAGGQLIVSGADEGTAIQVCDTDGQTVAQTHAAPGGTTRITLRTPNSTALEVHVGQQIVKLQK